MTNENIENTIVCEVHNALGEISKLNGWHVIYPILSQLEQAVPDIELPAGFKSDDFSSIFITKAIMLGHSVFEECMGGRDLYDFETFVTMFNNTSDAIIYDKVVKMVKGARRYRIQMDSTDTLSLLDDVVEALKSVNVDLGDDGQGDALEDYRISNFTRYWYQFMGKYKMIQYTQAQIKLGGADIISKGRSYDKCGDIRIETEINRDTIEPLIILAYTLSSAEQIMNDYIDEILGRNLQKA